MKLRVTPSNNGRTVGNAGNIKSAEGHLGQVTEQHYNIQSSPDAAYGDYSGDLAVAQATQQGFQAAAGVVDTIASGVKVYQDGRDNEEISKMHSDVGLFHETLMRELASDGEASADEKMDSYNEAMEDYKENLLNGSKLTSRGVKKAKSTFDVMTHDMKNKYATGQYQKDHISDYKGIQDAKFQNIQDIAVSVGQDGDPNGFMKVMNMAEELDKDLQNPTFQTMYGDKAEGIVRTKQMDVVSKYFKSLPPELAEQAMTNPDVEAGLVAVFGEATYAEFKDDITILMAKKAAKEETAVNKVSANVYQQYNKQLIAGEHLSNDTIYGDSNMTLRDQNRLAKQKKVNDAAFQKKVALNTKKESYVENGFLLTKREVDKHFVDAFPNFRTMPVEHKVSTLYQSYTETGVIPASAMRLLDNPLSSNVEEVAQSAKVLSQMQTAVPSESLKLSDEMIDVIAHAEANDFNPESIQEFQMDVRSRNLQQNNKRIILPVFKKQYGEDLTSDLEDIFDDGEVTPYIEREYLSVYAQKLKIHGNEVNAKKAAAMAMKHKYSVETVDGSNRITSDSITKEFNTFSSDQIKDLLQSELPDLEDFTLLKATKRSNGKHSYRVLKNDGRLVVNADGTPYEFMPSEKRYNKLKQSGRLTPKQKDDAIRGFLGGF